MPLVTAGPGHRWPGVVPVTGLVNHREPPVPAFLFDLDGTLIDSVYQNVIAWRNALATVDIDLSVWRIHRRIGMSGGLFISALLRETGRTLSEADIEAVQQAHGAGSLQFTGSACDTLRHRAVSSWLASASGSEERYPFPVMQAGQAFVAFLKSGSWITSVLMSSFIVSMPAIEWAN